MSYTSIGHSPSAARRSWLLAIASFGTVALLAACGSGATGSTAGSTTSPSQAPPAAPAVTPSVSCAQVTALRTALTNLAKSSVNANTDGQISTDLANIETALAALKGEVGPAFSAMTHQVSADLTAIGKHARELSSHPSRANLRATTTAVDELKTAAGPAVAIMRTDCPSS